MNKRAWDRDRRKIESDLAHGLDRMGEIIRHGSELPSRESQMSRSRHTVEDLFLLSCLSPNTTGLPFVVWVLSGSGPDVMVKVSMGPRTKPGEFVTVTVRPRVEVVGSKKLSAEHLDLLSRWIHLNQEPLIQFWTGEIAYTEDLLAKLRRS